MLAAYAGNTHIVDLLVKRGANAHLEDLRGRKSRLSVPLSTVCLHDNCEVECTMN